MTTFQRRSLLKLAGTAGALGAAGLLGACATAVPARARVLVVGGGYGGATAAKYVRKFSENSVDVVLVEPEASFVSCPMSNLVVGGNATIDQVTMSRNTLASNHGVQLVRDSVARIDATARTATLGGGATIAYDKMILSPGIDLMFDQVQGLREGNAAGTFLQAWKAGPETVALRRQLEAMPDGAVFAIAIPEAPYRCPPGPYERVCQVADYLKKNKPRSKIIVFDANQDLVSKPALFRRVWGSTYQGMIDYRPQHKAVGVAANTIRFETQDDFRAPPGSVLNVLPPMRAGAIAVQTGLANANARWCNVNYQTFESTAQRNIHVLGDSIQIAPAMPKSGHMANSHAKVAAAALVAEFNGWPVNPTPMLTNTCYSMVDAQNSIHVASVHAYNATERTFRTVGGSGGLSTEPNALEGVYAWGWARNIWADSLT